MVWNTPLCLKCKKPIQKRSQSIIFPSLSKENFCHVDCYAKSITHGYLKGIKFDYNSPFYFNSVKNYAKNIKTRLIDRWPPYIGHTWVYGDLKWAAIKRHRGILQQQCSGGGGIWGIGLGFLFVFPCLYVLLNWSRINFNLLQALAFLLLFGFGLMIFLTGIRTFLALREHERLIKEEGNR